MSDERLVIDDDGPGGFDELWMEGVDVHIERMDAGCLFVGLYRGHRSVFHGFIGIRKSTVAVVVDECALTPITGEPSAKPVEPELGRLARGPPATR